MAKRFTETDKWRDPWFCGLTERERLFWIFLLDNCDHAGIWQVNWLLVKVYFPGFEYIPSVFGNRIVEISAEKWFIPKFLKFQYPKGLKYQWSVTRAVIKILEDHDLIDTVKKLYGNSYLTLHGRVLDLDKDLDLDLDTKGGARGGIPESIQQLKIR